MTSNTNRREFTGKGNDGKPKSVYVAKVMTMTEDELYRETERAIWLSAYAANNPRSDYHWHVDVCYDECIARNKPELYQRAYDENVRKVGG